jgi:hypothetical protein
MGKEPVRSPQEGTKGAEILCLLRLFAANQNVYLLKSLSRSDIGN